MTDEEIERMADACYAQFLGNIKPHKTSYVAGFITGVMMIRALLATEANQSITNDPEDEEDCPCGLCC